ncbi:hypothetical protein BKI52_28370 [marine bacterium AO1-C]|nr:hypothetical protein BKI52_28370 [marine bacterium AO1-C]
MYRLGKILSFNSSNELLKKKVIIILMIMPLISYGQYSDTIPKPNKRITKPTYVKLLLKPKKAKIPAKIGLKNKYKTKLIAQNAIQHLIEELHNQAYLNARLDSITFIKDTLKAYIFTGEVFKWKNLDKGNLPKRIVNHVGFKEKFYKNKYFLHKTISKLQNRILTYSENHGYPYAQIRLDSITINKRLVSAKLQYDKGPLIILDTLRLRGKAKIKRKFLAKYLRLKEGDVYSQQKVKNAEQLLRQLPYVKVVKPPQTEFRAKKAFVNLFLRKRKANQVNLLVGILPNEREPNTIDWMGEFDLLLQNMFGSGKNLTAKWLRPEPQSQTINLSYTHPLLFNSYLDLQTNFNLLREDTSFVNINFGGNLSYNLSNGDKLSVSFNSRSSRVLNNSIFQNITRLPDTLDISFVSYGIGYKLSKLDDALFPTKGNLVNLSLEVGQKNIQRNPELSEDFYENIPLNTTQFVYKLSWQHYLPINQKSVVYWQLNTGTMVNDQLLTNELFRLGGINNLRGHNQNVFLASSFAIINLEYRILFDENSFLFVFYDQSWLQQKTINFFGEDTPLGFGMGLNFPTQAGIFNIVYALGQTKDLPISFNRSKIHFGFISRF